MGEGITQMGSGPTFFGMLVFMPRVSAGCMDWAWKQCYVCSPRRWKWGGMLPGAFPVSPAGLGNLVVVNGRSRHCCSKASNVSDKTVEEQYVKHFSCFQEESEDSRGSKGRRIRLLKLEPLCLAESFKKSCSKCTVCPLRTYKYSGSNNKCPVIVFVSPYDITNMGFVLNQTLTVFMAICFSYRTFYLAASPSGDEV